jgi:hypothetical protein
MALVKTDVSEEISASFIRVKDEEGAKFLWNIDSYKSHTAEHPRRRHSS